MSRSPLRNKFLNSKCNLDRRAYNRQRNICVSLIRQEKNRSFVTNNLEKHKGITSVNRMQLKPNNQKSEEACLDKKSRLISVLSILKITDKIRKPK